MIFRRTAGPALLQLSSDTCGNEADIFPKIVFNCYNNKRWGSWMARTMRLAIFWSLCVFMTFSPQQPAAQPVRSQIPLEIPVVEIEGLGFPRQIAGLIRIWRTEYDQAGPRFSVTYGTPGYTWVDIFVYDKQLKSSSGSPLRLAQEEVQSTIGAAQEHVRLGNYQSATVQEQSTSGLFAKAHLKIVLGEKEHDSFVFATVHEGKLVKIRLTSASGAASRQLAERFLEEYSRVLK